MATVAILLKRTGGVLRHQYGIQQAACRFSSSVPLEASQSTLERLRDDYRKEIEVVPEFQASKRLLSFLEEKASQQTTDSTRMIVPPTPPPNGYHHLMDSNQIRLTLDSVMATFCLHVEARIAALVGQGFYTIGPCGEETLSSVAHALREEDSAALHYRHLGINLARQLSALDHESLSDLLLDRARGYTVSRNDPVTGGVHCSIGSATGNDYIVTSTLASQCPPAVGRALGYAMTSNIGQRPISLVTLGDGSVHNHHFWSAFHLARHARHKRVKCPAVFGISDNGLSISYSTGGYVDTLFEHDPLVPLFRANGKDMMDVYSQSKLAIDYSRKQSAPSVILYKDLVRRFGHAATDRQHAYLQEEEIRSMADLDILESCMVQAVEVFSATTYTELLDRYQEIQSLTRSAFDTAADEDKVGRQDMLDRVAAKLINVPRLPEQERQVQMDGPKKGKLEVMRKHVTRVFEEIMEKDEKVVYIGEDVEHGGYYLATEGLVDKFPGRVLDFPPVSCHICFDPSAAALANVI